MSVLSRKAPRARAIVEESITVVLAEVGPLLRIEHCRLEIVEYFEATGRVMLRIDGSCADCEVSPVTFMPAIEAHLKLRVPEVREVGVIDQ
jgi:Fe-S cluster biogenesis protein NfuA